MKKNNGEKVRMKNWLNFISQQRDIFEKNL